MPSVGWLQIGLLRSQERLGNCPKTSQNLAAYWELFRAHLSQVYLAFPSTAPVKQILTHQVSLAQQVCSVHPVSSLQQIKQQINLQVSQVRLGDLAREASPVHQVILVQQVSEDH